MFENPRRGRQARSFTTNVSKILDLKSSSEQIFFRKLSLGAPAISSASASVTSNSPSSDDVSTSLAEVSKWIALALYKLRGAYIRSGYLTDQGYINSFRVGWGMEGDYCWNFMV